MPLSSAQINGEKSYPNAQIKKKEKERLKSFDRFSVDETLRDTGIIGLIYGLLIRIMALGILLNESM